VRTPQDTPLPSTSCEQRSRRRGSLHARRSCAVATVRAVSTSSFAATVAVHTVVFSTVPCATDPPCVRAATEFAPTDGSVIVDLRSRARDGSCADICSPAERAHPRTRRRARLHRRNGERDPVLPQRRSAKRSASASRAAFPTLGPGGGEPAAPGARACRSRLGSCGDMVRASIDEAQIDQAARDLHRLRACRRAPRSRS
jgi:hypothetical protein